MKKRMIASAFLLLLLVSLFTITATAAEITVSLADFMPEIIESKRQEDMAQLASVNSGTCGDNLTWMLDENGVLTISGTGPMSDFIREEDGHLWLNTPWNINQVKSVNIQAGVTSIGDAAFAVGDNASDYERNLLTKVDIPSSVISIGRYAFSSHTGLLNIDIPSSITTLEEFAFARCSNLKDAIIPEGVTLLKQGLFFQCENLMNVKIPSSVVEIEQGAFAQCNSLNNLSLSSNITAIGDIAFYGCSGLTNVTIPNSVASIGHGAFSGCMGLTRVDVESGNTKYSSENGVLFDKSRASLICYPAGKQETAYDVPNSVTSIARNAFRGCNRLISVTMPNSVTSIGQMAFSGCDALADVYYEGNKSQWKQISIDADNASLQNAAIHYNNDNQSNQPNTSNIASGECGEHLTWTLNETGVLTISGYGSMTDYRYNSPNPSAPWKRYRSNIQSVVIENGVSTIGIQAFIHCSKLTSVSIPDSVTEIKSQAFAFCDSLTIVTIPSSVTSIDGSVFSFSNALTTIYVKAGNSRYVEDNGVIFSSDKRTVVYYPPNKPGTIYDVPKGVTMIGCYAFCECIVSANKS